MGETPKPPLKAVLLVPPAPRPWTARHRALRRRRRLLAVLLLFAPTAWAGMSDVLRRAHYIAAFDHDHRKAYAASFVESIVFWSVILYAASRRHWLGRPFAALFVVLFTLAMGVEGAFHAFYNIYLSMDGQIHSKSFGWSILGTLPFSRPIVAANVASSRARSAALLLRLGAAPACARAWACSGT